MRRPKKTDDEVIAIFYAAGHQKVIAQQFDTTQYTVSKIKSGAKNYKRITARWCDAGILGATLITLAFTGAL